jgi:hypothetical protein
MNRVDHSIFRPDALRRYLESREASVLPRFVRPPMVPGLWLLLVLLVAGSTLASYAEVPVHISGEAVRVDETIYRRSPEDGIALVVFLAPERLSHLKVGQRLFVPLDPGRVTGRVIEVQPEIISPAVAQERFVISTAAARAIAQPSVVAIARLEPLPCSAADAIRVGAVHRADIDVGSRGVIALLRSHMDPLGQ